MSYWETFDILWLKLSVKGWPVFLCVYILNDKRWPLLLCDLHWVSRFGLCSCVSIYWPLTFALVCLLHWLSMAGLCSYVTFTECQGLVCFHLCLTFSGKCLVCVLGCLTLSGKCCFLFLCILHYDTVIRMKDNLSSKKHNCTSKHLSMTLYLEWRTIFLLKNIITPPNIFLWHCIRMKDNFFTK